MKINHKSIVPEIYDKPMVKISMGNGLKFTEEQIKSLGLEYRPEVDHGKRDEKIWDESKGRRENVDTVGRERGVDKEPAESGVVGGESHNNTKTI